MPKGKQWKKLKKEEPLLSSVTGGVFIGPEFGERDQYENLKIVP